MENSKTSRSGHQAPPLARLPMPQTPKLFQEMLENLKTALTIPQAQGRQLSSKKDPTPTLTPTRIPKPQTLGSGAVSSDEQVHLFKFTTPSSASSGHHQDPPLARLSTPQTPGTGATPPRRPPPPSSGPRAPCPPSSSGGPLPPPPAVALAPAKLLTPKTSGLGATRCPPPLSLLPRASCPPSSSEAAALSPAKLPTPKEPGSGAPTSTRRPRGRLVNSRTASVASDDQIRAYVNNHSFPPPLPFPPPPRNPLIGLKDNLPVQNIAPIPSAPPLPRSEAIFLPVQGRVIAKGRRRALGGSGRLRPHPPTASPPPPPLPTTPGSAAAALMRQPVSKKEKPKLAPKPTLTQILVKADQSTGKLTFQNSTLKRYC